jgi:hypothetical protein
MLTVRSEIGRYRASPCEIAGFAAGVGRRIAGVIDDGVKARSTTAAARIFKIAARAASLRRRRTASRVPTLAESSWLALLSAALPNLTPFQGDSRIGCVLRG